MTYIKSPSPFRRHPERLDPERRSWIPVTGTRHQQVEAVLSDPAISQLLKQVHPEATGNTVFFSWKNLIFYTYWEKTALPKAGLIRLPHQVVLNKIVINVNQTNDRQTGGWRQTTFFKNKPADIPSCLCCYHTGSCFHYLLDPFFYVVFSGSQLLSHHAPWSMEDRHPGPVPSPDRMQTDWTACTHHILSTLPGKRLGSENTQRKGRASDRTWPEGWVEWRELKQKRRGRLLTCCSCVSHLIECLQDKRRHF